MGQYREDATNSESGNVLFLILIAVILFAALSYAVTQSTQTGTKGVEDDNAAISAAQIVQYPSGLRTSVMRMVLSGVALDELEFNGPDHFDDLSSVPRGVFHPQGGGAAFQEGSSSIMEGDVAGPWFYNAEFEVENIGMETTGSMDGNEIIAFLPGIRRGICMRLNKESGVAAIPVATVNLTTSFEKNMDEGYVDPSGEIILGPKGTNGTDALKGQAFGCFQNSDGRYVYYHVIAER